MGIKPVELVIFIFYHILLKFEFCGVYASGLSLGAHYVNKLNTVHNENYIQVSFHKPSQCPSEWSTDHVTVEGCSVPLTWNRDWSSQNFVLKVKKMET